MKSQSIVFVIIALLLITGCGVPARPAIRIGIFPAPGAGVLYLAEAEDLFSRYDVYIELVELSCAHELVEAFVNGNLDAAVLPYSAYEEAARHAQLEAGVLLLMAAPDFIDTSNVELSWEHGANEGANEVVVLASKRGDVMQRRADWQKALLAYEHARLMLCSGSQKYVTSVAECQYAAQESLRVELERWTVFGCLQQDSLLGETGAYSYVNARWHGQLHLSAAVANQAQHLQTGRTGATRNSEAR